MSTPYPLKAHEIANKVGLLVGGERQRQHGDKADNFGRIAVLWNAYLQIRRDPSRPLDAVDVAELMSLMKKARKHTGDFNADDWMDDAGYTVCGAEIALQQETLDAA